jgi:isoleucyl-tRNA synthetase
VINEGLSQRAAAGIKVRQPLAGLSIKGAPKLFEEMDEEYITILKEELNIKTIEVDIKDVDHEVAIDTKLTPVLKREGMMREVVRNVQNARKQAGLNVDDRINLSLSAEDKELLKALDEHEDVIVSETLAAKFDASAEYAHKTVCKVEGAELTISIEKA